MALQLTFNRTDMFQDKYTCDYSRNVSCLIPINPLTTSLLCVFHGCLSIIITCGNLLVIMSIVYFRQLHTPTNYLILSLAVADLLVGVLVCPFSMALTESSCWYYESLLCKVRGGFDIALSNSSMLHLCCISVDNYYAVCQPLRYTTKINDHVATIMILVSWSISVVTGIGVMIAGFHKERCEDSCSFDIQIVPTFGYILSFYLPASVMLCIYLKIFQVAQRQAHSIHPFVYAWFYSWFRAAFRMIISGKIYRGDFGNSKLL